MTEYIKGQIMPQREPKPRFVTPLSLVLTEYLEAHPMSQLDFAEYLNKGIEIAVESINLCRKHGNVRLLDHIYGVQQYLDRLTREIGTAGSLLRAEPLCQRALAICEQQLGPDHPDTATSLNNLAALY